MSELINQDALDSQTYNPTTDASSIQLLQIMENTTYVPRTKALLPPLVDPDTVDPELKQFVEAFNAMSPENPYQGVIVNPIKCYVDDLSSDMAETKDVMITGILPQAPEYQYVWDSSNFDSTQTEIQDGLDKIEEHTDRITNNLQTVTGVAKSALALSALMNLLSNPCLGLDKFIGSIMDKGKKIIKSAVDAIKNELNKAKDLVNNFISSKVVPLINDIKEAMQIALSAINDFLNEAKNEILNFAKGLLKTIRNSLGDLRSKLNMDPCLKSLLKSIATPTALAVIL